MKMTKIPLSVGLERSLVVTECDNTDVLPKHGGGWPTTIMSPAAGYVYVRSHLPYRASI